MVLEHKLPHERGGGTLPLSAAHVPVLEEEDPQVLICQVRRRLAPDIAMDHGTHFLHLLVDCLLRDATHQQCVQRNESRANSLCRVDIAALLADCGKIV